MRKGFSLSGGCDRIKKRLDPNIKEFGSIIDMADGIFVIYVGGYIGSSTRSELAYAHSTGKLVRDLEER